MGAQQLPRGHPRLLCSDDDGPQQVDQEEDRRKRRERDNEVHFVVRKIQCAWIGEMFIELSRQRPLATIGYAREDYRNCACSLRYIMMHCSEFIEDTLNLIMRVVTFRRGPQKEKHGSLLLTK